MIAVKNSINSALYLEVDAGVRYWEDGRINGVDDEDGSMPLRQGKRWKPTINLETGDILGWPNGITADIHYKVCDDGQYYLLDANKNRAAKWVLYYVPDRILCLGDNGYGDYIIFKIDGNGRIPGWKKPEFDAKEWAVIDPQESPTRA